MIAPFPDYARHNKGLYAAQKGTDAPKRVIGIRLTEVAAREGHLGFARVQDWKYIDISYPSHFINTLHFISSSEPSHLLEHSILK
jgi:hypothetical protein